MTQTDNKHRVPEEQEPSALRRFLTMDLRELNIPIVPKVALVLALVLVCIIALRFGIYLGESLVFNSYYGAR